MPPVLRSLLKTPRFTFSAIFALALGIGATAAIFSIVDRIVIHQFPDIEDSDRVVWLFEHAGKVDMNRDSIEAANFADWRAETRSFEALGGVTITELTLTGGDGDPERVPGQAVTGDWFEVMGTRPYLGRLLVAGDGEPGPEPVAVVTYELWQRRFAGDPGLVGKKVEIDDRATLIVGVLPPGYAFPNHPGLVVPIHMTAAQWADREHGAFAALARLAPGVSVEAAQAELDVVMRRLAAAHPETNRELGVTPVPLRDVFDARGAAFMLLGACGLLLLIGCANVVNLLLARGVARRRELAVRHALGASRPRLVGHLFGEALVLAIAGAALGLLIAKALLDVLLAALPSGDAPLLIQDIRKTTINLDVIAFAAALACVTTLLVGLAPALRGSRIDLTQALKDGEAGAGAGRPRRRMMGALVTIEIALAMALTAGASVLIHSFAALQARPPGFVADGVYTLSLPLGGRHTDAAGRARFVDQVIARLAALPGADGVSATTVIPSTGGQVGEITVAGRPPPERQDRPMVHFSEVTDGFFHALRLPVTRGRALARADRDDRVVVISQSIALRLFPDEDPIGRYVRLEEDDRDREIVGVAQDVPHLNPRAISIGTVYLPYDGRDPDVVLLMRAHDPIAFAGLARAAVRELDPRQVVDRPNLLETVLAQRQARTSVIVWIASVTSLFALLLAALGVYGLVSYSASQRTREIGIRVALGARTGAVLKTIVLQGLVLATAGIALGLLLSLPITRAARALIYVPTAPRTALLLALVAAVLGAVAVVARLLPARRAARVDPMLALRHE
jgi:predicted permease